MSTRFKFKGAPVKLTHTAPTRDDFEFKEGDHPRASNGQFSSGGGVTGKQIHGGVTAPKKGTSAHNIWTYAALCEEKGQAVNTANVMAAAESLGVTLNKSNTQQTLPLYKKYQSGAKADGAGVVQPPKQEAAPKLDNTLANFEGVSASGGLEKEGTYGGVMYYKNSTGVKASYAESSNTWQLKQPDGTVTKGSELAELATALKTNAEKVHAMAKHVESQAHAAKIAAEASAKAAKEAAHSTKNAALYAERKAVTGQHNYTSKGAATEEAFSPGIQSAIHAYKGSTYKQINNAMRFDADYDNTESHIMKHVLNLQRGFALAPPTKQELNVSRKIGTEALRVMAKDAGIASLKDLQPGTIMTDYGVVSTSHSHAVWSGTVKFNATVPKGYKAIDISETINKGEQELLLPPGSRLKIKDVKENHKGFDFYITCEYL